MDKADIGMTLMKQFELNQLKELNDGRVRTVVVANNSLGFYSEALESLWRRTCWNKGWKKLQQVYKIEKKTHIFLRVCDCNKNNTHPEETS